MPAMRKYKSRNQTLSNKEADIVGRELEKLFPTGEMEPAQVVNAAQDVNSPLHKYFDWDNESAATKYRLQQARQLIRAIVVEIDQREVPAFHHVKIEGVNMYTSITNCLSDETLWDQVLNSALKEIEGWSRRYEAYSELKPIHSAIQEVKQNLHTQKGVPYANTDRESKEDDNTENRTSIDSTVRV